MASIDVITEINKLLTQQNALYASQAKMLKGQIAMTEKLVQVMSQFNTNQAKDSIEELNNVISETGDKLEELGTSSQGSLSNVAKHAETAAKKAANLEKNFTKAGKATGFFAKAQVIFGSLAKDVSFTASVFTSFAGIVGTVSSALLNVGISILTIPFKMLNGMISNIGSGSTELAQALEDTRKQFGDLKTGASKAVLDLARNMKGELANTGLSTFRIFGNLAEKIQEMLKYGITLGSMFNNLSKGMVANAEAVGAYVKGLGLTEDGMKGVGRQALITGKSFADIGREVTTFAYQMGESFGINGKEISRAMGDMMQDVKNFGSLSVKQLSQIAVFANKLGLSFQDLQGTIDAFDNFEDAAKGAAQLSQAFGLNLDVLDLINDQDPASRFDKLRKSFFATGKSVESMTRQELKLLAAQSGLTEEAVKLGFAQSNQGVSYEEIQKQAGIAEKKQLSQAEAMDKLANSIERLVKQGEMGSGGFFDRFFQGFSRGIAISQEYRQLMRSLRVDLRLVYRSGIETGRAFVEAFPGVKEFFGGLNDFFAPERFKKMMNGVTGAFRTFFTDLSSGKASLGDLFKNLQSAFFSNFNPDDPAGQKILSGFKKMLDAIKNIIVGIIPIIASGLRKGLDYAIDFIKNPKEFVKNLGFVQTGTEVAQEAGTGFFGPIFGALAEEAPALWEKVKELFNEIGKKIDFAAIGRTIGLALFGPAAIKAIVSAALSGIVTLGQTIFSHLTGSVATNPTSGGSLLVKFSEKLLGAAAAPAAIFAAIAGASVAINNGMKKFEGDLTSRFGEAEGKIAAGTTGIINALTFGLLPDDIQMKIAESIAGLSQAIFNSVSDYFGPNFTGTLKDMFAKSFDLFGSLGQMISDIFTGDENKIADSFLVFGEKTLAFLGSAFIYLIEGIPTILTKIAEFATRLSAGIFNTIGTTFKKLGDKIDIPVISSILRFIGGVFSLVGTIQKKIADGIGYINALFKKNGFIGTIIKGFESVGNFVSNTWTFIKTGFGALVNSITSTASRITSGIGDAFNFMIDVIKGGASLLFDIITAPFKLANDVISSVFNNIGNYWQFFKTSLSVGLNAAKEIFSNSWTFIKTGFQEAWTAVTRMFSLENITEVFGNVVKGITNALNELLNIPVFSNFIDIAKKAFGIQSPSRVFAGIGDNITAGLTQGLNGIPQAVTNTLSEANKAAQSGGNAISQNLQTSITPATSASKGSSVVAPQMPRLNNIDDMAAASRAMYKLAMDFAEVKTKDLSSGLRKVDLISRFASNAAEGITQLISAHNQIGAELASLTQDPIQLSTVLKGITDALHISSNEKFSIKSDKVNIEINLQVKIDADEFEQALKGRSGGSYISFNPTKQGSS